MKRIVQTIILICGILPYTLYAQYVVKGTVKDGAGVLPYVSIIEKDLPTNGVMTNENGYFQIKLKGKSNTIVVRSIGYISQEINVNGKNNIEVLLLAEVTSLEEVVVVGYGTTKKITNTGAISSISASEIRSIPTANVQNTLAGRVPGFFSQQRSGQPGQTGSDFYIRGVNSLSSDSQKPLIIVDDVEYSYDQVAQLDANEIETFTVLKDASTTAIYGIKGANGVLVITTRRGKLGKPKVNFNSESGLQAPVHKPNFLGAYQTALLRNEALSNDGIAPDFTAEDLEHWRLGDDPYGHPDVNWYDQVFKDYSYQIRNNIDISGGSEKIRYFVSAGQLSQNGMMRDFSRNTDSPENNYDYQRYNFRSNLDMRATKYLRLRLDVTGRIGTTTEPHIATSPLSTIYSFQRLPPYAEPLLNPDGSYPWAKRSRSSYYETSLIGRLALQGYDKIYRNELNVLLSADHNLDFITRGLSVKSLVAFAGDISYDRSLSRDNIPAFYYDPTNQTYTIHSNGLYRLEPLTLSSSSQNSISKKAVNTQANINYDRLFGNHHVYGLLLYNLKTNTGASYSTTLQEFSPVTSQGTTFRAGYSYKQRYLIEFNGAYNGTSQFVGKQKLGFFPAISVGWNIAEEPLIKKNLKFLELFKLRGSFGLTGSDITSGNTYKTEQIYTTGTGYNFGETSNTATSIQEGSLGNLSITWEKSRKLDIGIDGMLFNGKLSFTFDYFYDRRYDQLIKRQDVLQIIGVSLPYTNSGVTENKGFDGQISYHARKGLFTYSAGLTFSIAKNKILFNGEATPKYPWLATVGRSIGISNGYNWIGYYQNQADVDSSAHLANAKPGDLKYQDINDDGIIDQQDIRGIGKPNLPQTVLGTTLGFGYGGFSLNILFQGSFNYSYRIAASGIIPFQGNLQQSALGRWTSETALTATYPRLSSDLAGPSSPSNNSTFWLINAKYIRLKSVELGYTLPKTWLNALRLSSARIYISGFDMYTWSNFSLYSQDPEIASAGSAGTYPVQKVYNLGLQVGF